jgi:hypothetical protein
MKPESLLTVGVRTFWPLFGAMWLACGVLLVLIGGAVAWGAYRFERVAIVREGRVISKALQPAGSRSSSSRVVTYRFATLDGREIIGRQAVKARTWNAVEEGTRVRIAYLLDDPSRNRLAEERDLPGAFMVFGAGGVASAFGGALVRRGIAKYRRHHALRLDGIPARATVTAVNETRSRRNRPPQWLVTYRYKDRQGRQHQGQSGHLPPDEVEGLRTGDTRAVRYDPNDPADSIWVGDEKR